MKINNFESSDSEIKKFIEVSNDAGFSREEKREVLKSAGENKKQKPDSENTENENGADNSGLLEKIDSQNVKAFMELIAGNEKIDYRALVDIGNNLREYGSRGNQEKILSPEDQKIISLITKYIEDWFYSDGIVKMISSEGAEGNRDLGSAAFIVNQLAKIKEIPEYGESTANFDLKKLNHFIEEISQNIPKFFSLEKVDADIAKVDTEIEQEKKRLAEEFEVAKKAATPFIERVGELERNFSETIKDAVAFTEQNIDKLPDDFHSEIEDIKILCSKIKKQLFKDMGPTTASDLVYGPVSGALIDSVTYSEGMFSRDFVKNGIKTLNQFLQGEKAKTKEIDYKDGAQKKLNPDFVKNPDSGLPQIDYEALLDALEKISSKDYTTDAKENNNLWSKIYETGYFTFKKEIENMNDENNDLYHKKNELVGHDEYSLILVEFKKSKMAVQEALRDEDGPAALYLIKQFLVVAAEMRMSDKHRKEKKEQKLHMFNPKAIDNPSFKNRLVYNFESGKQDRFDRSSMFLPSFNEVHLEPKHTVFSLFAMEYQWQKYNKNI